MTWTGQIREKKKKLVKNNRLYVKGKLICEVFKITHDYKMVVLQDTKGVHKVFNSKIQRKKEKNHKTIYCDTT